MRKQYLSFSQRVQIYNFIKTVGELNDERWEYKEGWDDRKVAEQFKASLGNVMTIRMELGRLRTGPSAPYSQKIVDLETKIKVLEEHVEIWSNAVKELEARINTIHASALSHGWRIKEQA